MGTNGDGFNVLLVEDSPTQMAYSRGLLEKEGYMVRTANNGAEALISLGEELPRMIISDCDMPLLDGFQLCRLLKDHSSTRPIPVLLLTGTPTCLSRFWARTCGADAFLRKGGTSAQFLDLVRVLVNTSKNCEDDEDSGSWPIRQSQVSPMGAKDLTLPLSRALEHRLLETTVRNEVASLEHYISDPAEVGWRFMALLQDPVSPGALYFLYPDIKGYVFHVLVSPSISQVTLDEFLKPLDALPFLGQVPAERQVRIMDWEPGGNPSELCCTHFGLQASSCEVQGQWGLLMEKCNYQIHRNLFKEASAEFEMLFKVMVVQNLLETTNTKLKQADESKTNFLASMSHEIRTPLNAVLGFSQLLLKEQGLSNRQQDYLRTINRAGDHLLSLINDVLELARIEAGRVSLKEESFDLYRFVEDLALMFRIRATGKGLLLESSMDPGVPRWVLADVNKLRQILINLLGNAVKFTSTGRVSLEVRAEAKGETYRIQMDIKDTGPGIATEDLQRLFSAFEQTAVGASKGGAGLGLVISRKFAKLMGGDIEAHSEGGKGSCFSLSFEAKPGEVVPVSSTPRKHMARARKGQSECRVLVVDDNEDSRVLLREMLDPLGITISEASNGQEALDTFEVWKPDAVLMDIQMPGMDGLEVIRRIKATERGHHTKVLVVSAHALDFKQREAFAAGADGFIPKPFRETQILDTLWQALGLDYGDPPEETEKSTVLGEGSEPSNLDSDVHSRLRQAATLASYDEILEILASLESKSPRIAAQLQEFIERFDYPGLVVFLDTQAVSCE